MKQIAEELKAHLDSISDEQFELEWKQIKSLGLGGPTVDEFICCWESAHPEMAEVAGLPEKIPLRKKIPVDIIIPKKLTPDYRGFSFFY